jgi:hypothetical protein
MSISMTTNHFNAIICTRIKIQRQEKIQTTVSRESYVAEGGAVQAQKRCGSKMLSTSPKSCACLGTNPTKTHGLSLVVKPHPDLKDKLVNE